MTIAMPVSPPDVGAETPDYHIEAQSSLTERSLRTLKDGDAFAVLDIFGDIGSTADTAEGLFYRDMRFLSRFEVRFSGRRPMMLSSVVQDDNAALTVDLTNPDIEQPEHQAIPRDTIAISRTKFLWNEACYERIGLRNYGAEVRNFSIEIVFDADFHDLFEVRGMERSKRGKIDCAVQNRATMRFLYAGLDGVDRRTTLTFDPPPRHLDSRRATFDVSLPIGGQAAIVVIIAFDESDEDRGPLPVFLSAYRSKRRATRQETAHIATIESSNSLFNEMMCRSTADVYMLLTRTRHGAYPYAGIPWYSTVFGRDGIITAMLTLWLDPEIARGVLIHLADTQATEHNPAADAQPGKIIHERRHCEMARLGEVPFRRYYGTVDATPLFVMLAGMYFERTGDTQTLERIWPNVKRALEWCDTFGDRDGDGFVEYYRETPNGLANQGWKDSHDSIFHADGSNATGAIALVEVQAYVYGAKLRAAELARHFGDDALATALLADSAGLRTKFHDAFWCEDIQTYALALDGDKRACKVRTSNAGHALFTGIATPEAAAGVARTLMRRDMFTGWGIRTLAQGEPRYNPMSYHNGSVWPHDNALIALGLGKYNFKDEASAIFRAIFAANTYQQDRRLPELFCGFGRKPGRGPTAYPVACSPQAWAAATPFALLAACLGISVPHAANQLHFVNPVLPDFLDEVVLRRVPVGTSRIDVRLARHGSDVAVNVLKRDGGAQAVIWK